MRTGVPRGGSSTPRSPAAARSSTWGVHAIDTARFLLGDPEPGRVCAVIGTRYGTYEVDDDATRFYPVGPGHEQRVIEAGWWHPHKEGLEAETEVYGTGGYARIFPRSEPSEDDRKHCTQPMYTAQMREFLTAIDEGRPPRPSGEDGRVVGADPRRRRTRRPARPDVEPETGIEPVTSSLPWRHSAD